MQAEFKHPVLHVISWDAHRVIWSEPFVASAWLSDRQVINRGAQAYKIVHQQTGVDHYYVWVRPVQ